MVSFPSGSVSFAYAGLTRFPPSTHGLRRGCILTRLRGFVQ